MSATVSSAFTAKPAKVSRISLAAATVAGAARAGAMPGQANKQGPAVAEVRRPPALRAGHQRLQILLHRRRVKALEIFGAVGAFPQGISFNPWVAKMGGSFPDRTGSLPSAPSSRFKKTSS
jgi:hypothetical protein